MRALYNILFLVGFGLSAPYYFWKMWRRGSWREGFGQRFGNYEEGLRQSLAGQRVIWLHAVSVGEVNVCTQLIKALEPRLPDVKIVVSTTTSTGMGLLRDKLPEHIGKVYYPIDRRRYVQRALETIHPEAVVLVEAEIWPNFLWTLADRHIPAFLVNARLSERSFRGYRRSGFLFRPLFAAFTGVGAQNEADAGRLRELGCRLDAVSVVGSLKFDAAKLDGQRLLDVPALYRQLGWPTDALTLVAGSTHAGEEVLLARMFQRLRVRHPQLRLVLVPRHFERTKAVVEELAGIGIRPALRSELKMDGGPVTGTPTDCLLVNTTGELRYFYEDASVIFVGKSLTAKGGQNPIEPGALGKAMLFGPNMQNFVAIAESFVVADGAVQVPDAAGLEGALEALLADPVRREALGENALAVVKANLGAVERTADLIAKRLAGRTSSGAAPK